MDSNLTGRSDYMSWCAVMPRPINSLVKSFEPALSIVPVHLGKYTFGMPDVTPWKRVLTLKRALVC